MTRLHQSVAQANDLLAGADLSADSVVRQLLEITHERRRLDLSDLSPAEQAALIDERTEQLQPSPEALAQRVEEAQKQGRPFVAKFGIDPTGADVHLGHTVPMLLLSRLQRMGHHVVFIVGDVTAKIGDPSGRSDERPVLTDADIARNLATYQHQVSPFFDFSKAEFRHNGDWLRQVTLPRLIEVTAHVPLAMSLQREDFRNRLSAGHSLSLAELLYSVAMALDSVEVRCDLEVGGLDQFLNMQMCRKVMEICGQVPEIVLATWLLEGTDGGAKMSASRGNYVPLTAPAGEIFGKLMSVPDRLMEPYLRALSEWQGPELASVTSRLGRGSLHPMDLKKILAGEVTAALHGVAAAMKAREEFEAQFSRHHFDDVADMPGVSDLSQSVADALKDVGFATSNGEVRRLAGQNGLRLVLERSGPGDGAQVVLGAADVYQPLEALVKQHFAGADGTVYLKAGRKLARLVGPPGGLS
jgi:tyrosyl-tRNA synthetase